MRFSKGNFKLLQKIDINQVEFEVKLMLLSSRW